MLALLVTQTGPTRNNERLTGGPTLNTSRTSGHRCCPPSRRSQLRHNHYRSGQVHTICRPLLPTCKWRFTAGSRLLPANNIEKRSLMISRSAWSSSTKQASSFRSRGTTTTSGNKIDRRTSTTSGGGPSYSPFLKGKQTPSSNNPPGVHHLERYHGRFRVRPPSPEQLLRFVVHLAEILQPTRRGVFLLARLRTFTKRLNLQFSWR